MKVEYDMIEMFQAYALCIIAFYALMFGFHLWLRFKDKRG